MTDKNINLGDTEDEKQRYGFNMLPTYLLMKGVPEAKGLVRKVTKELSKVPRKQKVQIADIFDSLATTQEKGNIKPEDINLEKGGLSSHPYESVLRMFGINISIHLLEHAKLVDCCLSQRFNEQLIIDLKVYLFETFNYEDNELNTSMTIDEFYNYLVISLIAHLDARIHNAVYSKDIIPISLGWLFMHKLNPDKWEYDTTTKKYKLTNKNGSPFTCTSRSFIHFILTDLYLYSGEKTKQVRKNSKPKEMPKGHYGLRNEINWRTDDEDGQLYSFLDRKSERDSKRNWISLEEFYWLLGMEKSQGDKSNKVLASWQVSMNTYMKTEKIDDIGGLPSSAEGIIWFIYAFFQNIYEQTDKLNKQTKQQNFFIYDEYYGLWESMTDYYELQISADIKKQRAEWPDYLKKQATRIEHVA